MKTKAYTVRLNLDVVSERKLYDLLKADSENFRSEAECIKSRLIDFYNSNNEGLEEILLRSQKALIESMYDTCLKVISSVSGIKVSNITDVEKDERAILPEISEEFPDGLNDVLDFLAS